MKILSVLTTLLALGSAVFGLDAGPTSTGPPPFEDAVATYSAQFGATDLANTAALDIDSERVRWGGGCIGCSAAGMLRPLKLFGLPVAMARSVKRATMLCARDGNSACAQDLTHSTGTVKDVMLCACDGDTACGQELRNNTVTIEDVTLCVREGDAACAQTLADDTGVIKDVMLCAHDGDATCAQEATNNTGSVKDVMFCARDDDAACVQTLPNLSTRADGVTALCARDGDAACVQELTDLTARSVQDTALCARDGDTACAQEIAELASGASGVARPPKIFSVPMVMARVIQGAPLCSRNGKAARAPKLKFVGPNPETIKAEANHTSSSSGMLRPLKIFGLPVALARTVKGAALYSRNGKTAACAPKLKFMGANPGTIKAATNHTSGASGMPRPLRLFSLPIHLVQRIDVRITPPELRTCDTNPKVEFKGANSATIREKKQTSGGPGQPQVNDVFSCPRLLWARAKAAIFSSPQIAGLVSAVIDSDHVSKITSVEPLTAPSTSAALLREI